MNSQFCCKWVLLVQHFNCIFLSTSSTKLFGIPSLSFSTDAQDVFVCVSLKSRTKLTAHTPVLHNGFLSAVPKRLGPPSNSCKPCPLCGAFGVKCQWLVPKGTGSSECTVSSIHRTTAAPKGNWISAQLFGSSVISGRCPIIVLTGFRSWSSR